MMDCKQALTESKGDMEGAIVLLRKKGVATAAKKARYKPIRNNEIRYAIRVN